MRSVPKTPSHAGATATIGRATLPAANTRPSLQTYEHSCAIRFDDTITCWGLNNNGQADAPSGKHMNVIGGRNHSCAIRFDDTITCWGSNRQGQVDAPSGKHKIVAAGWYHSPCDPLR